LAQTGIGAHPTITVAGLLSCVSALGFLTLAKELGPPGKQTQGSALAQNGADQQLLAVEENGARHAPKQLLSSSKALAIIVLAGCCSSLWSPLSTFARKPAPGINEAIRVGYVTAFVFPLGVCCAYPSVALLGARLGGVSIKESFQMLTVKRAIFGCLCGAVVNSGFIMYFLSSVPVSPVIVFGFCGCNPVLSLVLDSVGGRFRNGGVKQWIALLISGMLYLTAIALLAMASQ